MPKRIDITNTIFGQLTALEPTEKRRQNGSIFWLCQCTCGALHITSVDQLRDGSVQSCGCRIGGYKHGLSRARNRHPLYWTWCDMLQRCYNKNAISFKYYGAKGVTVCERWRKFENFLKDVGERPKDHQHDRIDPNGNYTPENIRWATIMEQRHNRRT